MSFEVRLLMLLALFCYYSQSLWNEEVCRGFTGYFVDTTEDEIPTTGEDEDYEDTDSLTALIMSVNGAVC